MANRGGYGLVPQSNFSGGLNLTVRPDLVEPSQAIDLRNVTFPAEGGIKQRDAWRLLTDIFSPITNAPTVMTPHYESSGARQLLVGNGSRVDVVTVAGTILSSTATAQPVMSFTRFGAPGTEWSFVGIYDTAPMRWNGGSLATPAYVGITPTGSFLAVQATDNRLMVANEVMFPDRVRFSNEGDPLGFDADNYVDLRPGSGEPITALTSWREYVFAFKQSEFFVFYGTSTDSLGKPIFNVRPISVEAGSYGQAVAGPEGVYFMDGRGIWLTKGSEPKLVSDAIEGIFTGIVSPYYTGGILNTDKLSKARMAYYSGKLYVAFQTTTAPTDNNNKLAVYDTSNGVWSLFDIPASALTTFRFLSATSEQLVFGMPTHANHVGLYYEGGGLASDGNTALGNASAYTASIVSHWRQGWQSYGSPDQKWMRQSKLWGTGSILYAVTTDYSVGYATYTDVDFTFPGNDVAAPWLVSQSHIGHMFSVYISGTNEGQPWSLNSLEHGFRQGRGPEVLGRG